MKLCLPHAGLTLPQSLPFPRNFLFSYIHQGECTRPACRGKGGDTRRARFRAPPRPAPIRAPGATTRRGNGNPHGNSHPPLAANFSAAVPPSTKQLSRTLAEPHAKQDSSDNTPPTMLFLQFFSTSEVRYALIRFTTPGEKSKHGHEQEDRQNTNTTYVHTPRPEHHVHPEAANTSSPRAPPLHHPPLRHQQQPTTSPAHLFLSSQQLFYTLWASNFLRAASISASTVSRSR